MFRSENDLKRAARAWQLWWTKTMREEMPTLAVPDSCGRERGCPCVSLIMCHMHRNATAKARSTRLGCNRHCGFSFRTRETGTGQGISIQWDCPLCQKEAAAAWEFQESETKYMYLNELVHLVDRVMPRCLDWETGAWEEAADKWSVEERMSKSEEFSVVPLQNLDAYLSGLPDRAHELAAYGVLQKYSLDMLCLRALVELDQSLVTVG